MVKTINGALLAICLALPLASGAQDAQKSAAAADDAAQGKTATDPQGTAASTKSDATGPRDDAASVPGDAAAVAQSDAEARSAPVSDDPAFAEEIVRKADAIRFPTESFQVDVHVESTSEGEAQEPRVYRVLSKGNEDTIVQTLEPATERGQNMLMSGRDLWVFMPSVSQPVRLSLSQRLTGQVSNGDLARANFSGDYTPKLLRIEKIDGRDHYVLELTAARRGVTYPRVLYWVRAEDHHPHKAEFHAVSGRLLKTCVYEEFKPLGGQVRPTRLVMSDALKPGDRSVLEYSELELRDLPDRMFTKNYMKRLD